MPAVIDAPRPVQETQVAKSKPKDAPKKGPTPDQKTQAMFLKGQVDAGQSGILEGLANASIKTSPDRPLTPISEPPLLKTADVGAYKITMQALSEKISQEADQGNAVRLKRELVNVVADYFPQLPDDKATAFIAEFNQNNHGLLKSQEFRLLQSRGEKVVMIDASGNLNEMVVTKENARSALDEIKGKDEVLRGNSYDLRKEIVQRSKGEIATYEVYTYPVDIPQGGKLDQFLDNPDNWLPERRMLQQQIIDQEYAKALALSARLGDPEPSVYALRGNTAAGKTTATRSDELFRKALDENGQPSGAINPDTYKTELKSSEIIANRQTIGHHQAHEEGSMIARKISGKIAESESSMVIDKRMNKAKNITELVATAEQNGKLIKILDVDVPLEASLIRVLGRKIGGEDPTVPFDAIIDGFEGIRQNRAVLIEQVINNPKIKDYVLYVASESGISTKAAQKVNGEFMVIEGQEDAFRRAVSKDTDSTVAEMTTKVIDESYIGDALTRVPEAQQSKVRAALERYKGKTMKEALDLHSQKLNEGE